MEVRCVSNRVCTVDKAGVRTCDESIPDAKKTLKGVGIENPRFFGSNSKMSILLDIHRRSDLLFFS